MPGRNIPLVTNQAYHIVNRGIASQPIYVDAHDYRRKLDTIFYYQNNQPPIRYSFFMRQSLRDREEILNNFRKNRFFLVDVLAYCLMPNHIHLLVLQKMPNGISTFMGQVANSYTRYFNTRHNRKGPIFQGKFKAVRIETDDQLLHVSRYIHLNPYTSYIVKSMHELETYPYSSLSEYLTLHSKHYCETSIILDHFQNVASYRQFLYDRAEYQRNLESIKHLILED